MWALRDERYGGLVKRYTKRQWGAVRCVDPISAQALSFPTQLHYENWLLHYARTDVIAIDASPAPLEYLDCGRLRTACFDVLLHLSTGVREVQLVVRQHNARTRARCEALQVAAGAFGFFFAPRTRESIRANITLLNNLARLRQLLVSHADALSAPTLELLQHYIDKQPLLSRQELLSSPISALLCDPQRVDAALFKLYVARRIQLNLHEVPYGTETRIVPFH